MTNAYESGRYYRQKWLPLSFYISETEGKATWS